MFYVRNRLAIALILCLFLGIAWSAQQQLPTRISDDAFWQMISDFSEPTGRFPSDNFVSNELGIQRVLTDLANERKNAGAYLGVGPEQNFTYIVALEPKIAFIVDIRRQNMIEHLMYKAMIEMSADRVDFISRLFSRPRPADLSKNAPVKDIFEAFTFADPDPKMYTATMDAIEARFKEHNFKLSVEDQGALEYVMRAFYVGGPELGYSSVNQTIRPAVRVLPTYEELMNDTDGQGKVRSYLASEESFQTLKKFETNNLIVPLVGDFAGPKALRAVGKYLKEHDTTVSAFYLSNVEQYLFMSEDWKAFYANVGTLPVDSKSVFIRPLINTGAEGYSASPLFRAGFHFDTLLFPIRDLVTAFNDGMIQTYYDVIGTRN